MLLLWPAVHNFVGQRFAEIINKISVLKKVGCEEVQM